MLQKYHYSSRRELKTNSNETAGFMSEYPFQFYINKQLHFACLWSWWVCLLFISHNLIHKYLHTALLSNFMPVTLKHLMLSRHKDFLVFFFLKSSMSVFILKHRHHLFSKYSSWNLVSFYPELWWFFLHLEDTSFRGVVIKILQQLLFSCRCLALQLWCSAHYWGYQAQWHSADTLSKYDSCTLTTAIKASFVDEWTMKIPHLRK